MNSFRRWLPFIIIFLVIWGIIFVGTSGLLASKSDFDFTPGWVGCRTLYSGETPYTLDITHTIQMAMFDRLLEPDEDQQAFAYPANICLSPLIPFWLMPLRVGVYAWSSLQFLLYLLMLMVFLPRFLRRKSQSDSIDGCDRFGDVWLSVSDDDLSSGSTDSAGGVCDGVGGSDVPPRPSATG